MKKYSYLLLAAGLILVVTAFTAVTAEAPGTSNTKVVVHHNPGCSCCTNWFDHMREAGFEVEVIETDDIQSIKQERGVMPAFMSCGHSAIVEGYVLEGHIPADAVKRLLEEKPDIQGISVPGMPLGSPGMEIGDPENFVDYDILSFDDEGNTEVFQHVEAGGS